MQQVMNNDHPGNFNDIEIKEIRGGKSADV